MIERSAASLAALLILSLPLAYTDRALAVPKAASCSLALSINAIDSDRASASAKLECLLPPGSNHAVVAVPFAIGINVVVYQEPTDTPVQYLYGPMSERADFAVVSFPMVEASKLATLSFKELRIPVVDTTEADSGKAVRLPLGAAYSAAEERLPNATMLPIREVSIASPNVDRTEPAGSLQQHHALRVALDGSPPQVAIAVYLKVSPSLLLVISLAILALLGGIYAGTNVPVSARHLKLLFFLTIAALLVEVIVAVLFVINGKIADAAYCAPLVTVLGASITYMVKLWFANREQGRTRQTAAMPADTSKTTQNADPSRSDPPRDRRQR